MFSYNKRYWVILGLAIFSYISTLFTETYTYYRIDLSHSLLTCFFVFTVFLVWELNRVIEKGFQAFYNLFKENLPELLIHFVISSILIVLVIIIPFHILSNYIFKYSLATEIVFIKLILAYVFHLNIFLNSVNFVIYYMKKLRMTQMEAEEFRKMSLQAQYDSLKYQVNPHFLFNNLNVLATLVHKDQEMASDFILQLSKVYRYILQNYEKELVELGPELDFIRSYIFLLEKRFAENIKVQIEVEDKHQKMYVVPVAIQMLIENAIKHNIVSKKRPLNIRIAADENYLMVENNLQLKEIPESSTHLGLKNINQRYAYIGSRKIEVKIKDEKFIVKIPLLVISSN